MPSGGYLKRNMRKSVFAIMISFLLLFAVGNYFLEKRMQAMSVPQKVTVVNKQKSNKINKKNKGNSEGTTITPESNADNSNNPGPGTIIFPASADSNSNSTNGSTGNSGATGDLSTANNNGSDNSSAGATSSNGQTMTSVPMQSVPINTSPPPPSPQTISGETPTESLSYTPEGQMILGAPANLLTYPIIKDGTSYQGTIEPSSSLNQSDVKRLASYPKVSATDIFDPPSTQIIEKPVGSYVSDSAFRSEVDNYIKNLGPHIQRKLQTGDWAFTPAPDDAYMIQGNTNRGHVIIPGVLRVRYNNSNNPLHLNPGVWYSGDVELGVGTTFFFTNNPQDRIPRTILMSIVILGNWG